MKSHERAAPAAPRDPGGGKALLVLEDGMSFWGKGLGAFGQALGEVCLNTSMTGYQEILTDPSSLLCGPDHHLHLPTHRKRGH